MGDTLDGLLIVMRSYCEGRLRWYEGVAAKRSLRAQESAELDRCAGALRFIDEYVPREDDGGFLDDEEGLWHEPLHRYDSSIGSLAQAVSAIIELGNGSCGVRIARYEGEEVVLTRASCIDGVLERYALAHIDRSRDLALMRAPNMGEGAVLNAFADTAAIDRKTLVCHVGKRDSRTLAYLGRLRERDAREVYTTAGGSFAGGAAIVFESGAPKIAGICASVPSFSVEASEYLAGLAR